MSAKEQRTRTRVGKYELGKTIGEGSFAKVRVAKNVETGDVVAIKILDRDQVLRHKMVEQLKREISTMKLIKHPNVIKIFEVMASKTKIYIVIEFADGGELFDKIAKHGRLGEDEARRYFQQLINAVDYCHSRGVFHRDLKPENLLLDSHGVLKVSDFGLSALSQQLQGDGLLHTACGTPNYVAPEVLKDKGYDGTASDVWSCGVILYVLMAGYLPFDEPSLMALYLKICTADFTFPSWFSSGAKKLIRRILDPEPLTRITVAEIIEDEWFKKEYRPPQFEQEEHVNVDDVDAVFNDSTEHLVTEKKKKPASMNAFELISKTQGFSLENLFGKQAVCKTRILSVLLKFSIPGATIVATTYYGGKVLIIGKAWFCKGDVYALAFFFPLKSMIPFGPWFELGVVKRETRIASHSPANEIMSRIEEAAKPLGFNVDKRNYKMKLKGDKGGRKGQLSVATEVFEVAPSLHMVELRKIGGDTLEFHNFYKSFSSGLKDVVWKSDQTIEGLRS